MSSQRVVLYRFFAAAVIIAVMSCIQRDNYWDPLNYTVVFQRNVHDSAIMKINSGLNLESLKNDISTRKNLLSSTSLQNAQLLDNDSLIRIENDRKRAVNSAVMVENDKLVPIDSTFTLKTLLDTLFLLMTIPDTLSTLEALKAAVLLERERVDFIITMTNASTAIVIFPPPERDSILAGYSAIIQECHCH